MPRSLVASEGACNGGRMPDHAVESSEPPDGSTFRYLQIEVSPAGIAERGRDGRPVVSVPRDELRTVELRYGPPGERLLVQTIIGATVLVVGLALGRGVVTRLLYGGYANLNAGAGSVTFTLGGTWLLWRAWRPPRDDQGQPQTELWNRRR